MSSQRLSSEIWLSHKSLHYRDKFPPVLTTMTENSGCSNNGIYFSEAVTWKLIRYTKPTKFTKAFSTDNLLYITIHQVWIPCLTLPPTPNMNHTPVKHPLGGGSGGRGLNFPPPVSKFTISINYSSFLCCTLASYETNLYIWNHYNLIISTSPALHNTVPTSWLKDTKRNTFLTLSHLSMQKLILKRQSTLNKNQDSAAKIEIEKWQSYQHICIIHCFSECWP